MARKINIDSDNTLQQWIDSQNTMSDYMGNLDSFRSDILTNFDSDMNVTSGTSFVSALNYIYDPLLTKLLNLFDGTGSTNFDKLNLIVDSGTFNVMRIKYMDSSFGGTPPHNSHLFASDSHIRASHADGDSPGSTNLNSVLLNGYTHLIPAFTHDLYVESGATFNNLTVRDTTDFFGLDSGHFDGVHIQDSGQILSLMVDSGGVLTISQANIVEFVDSSYLDSADVDNVLRSNIITTDSANISNANINNLKLDSDLIFTNIRFRTTNRFNITDSLGPDTINDPGVIYFGGFTLDSV